MLASGALALGGAADCIGVHRAREINIDAINNVVVFVHHPTPTSPADYVLRPGDTPPPAAPRHGGVHQTGVQRDTLKAAHITRNIEFKFVFK